MGCWPLLVQKLGEIVRVHGSVQHARVQHQENSIEEVTPAETKDLEPVQDTEVVGVLLAQLKPLLRRHWDAGFEERLLGYFNDKGNYISVKKMKHLLGELLKWQACRRALIRTRGFSSAVDAAFDGPPLALAICQRQNDMVLCCPSLHLNAVPPALAIERKSDPGVLPGLQMPECEEQIANKYSDETMSPQKEDNDATTSRAQLDGLEIESRQLRIENAELKKRLRFESEFFHSQIRRLRIENAELKKRVFFLMGHLHTFPYSLFGLLHQGCSRPS